MLTRKNMDKKDQGHRDLRNSKCDPFVQISHIAQFSENLIVSVF